MFRYAYQRASFIAVLAFAVGIGLLTVSDVVYLVFGVAALVVSAGFFAMSLMMRRELQSRK